MKYCKDADIVGWIGNLGFILGAMAIAAMKPIEGQWLNIVGNALYIYVAARTKLPSLVILSIVLAVINIVGIVNWTGG